MGALARRSSLKPCLPRESWWYVVAVSPQVSCRCPWRGARPLPPPPGRRRGWGRPPGLAGPAAWGRRGVFSPFSPLSRRASRGLGVGLVPPTPLPRRGATRPLRGALGPRPPPSYERPSPRSPAPGQLLGPFSCRATRISVFKGLASSRGDGRPPVESPFRQPEAGEPGGPAARPEPGRSGPGRPDASPTPTAAPGRPPGGQAPAQRAADLRPPRRLTARRDPATRHPSPLAVPRAGPVRSRLAFPAAAEAEGCGDEARPSRRGPTARGAGRRAAPGADYFSSRGGTTFRGGVALTACTAWRRRRA